MSGIRLGEGIANRRLRLATRLSAMIHKTRAWCRPLTISPRVGVIITSSANSLVIVCAAPMLTRGH
jgi:hypothetical protein